MYNFPARCFRGIRKKDWIGPEGKLRTNAFIPNHKPREPREDGLIDASINWELDPKALEFTLAQPSAEFGAAGLKRIDIESINLEPDAIDAICYEHKAVPDNPYHGNIVFGKNIPKLVEKFVAGRLVVLSEFPCKSP